MVGAFSFEINMLAQAVEYPWWCMKVSVHCCVYELLSVSVFLFFGWLKVRVFCGMKSFIVYGL